MKVVQDKFYQIPVHEISKSAAEDELTKYRALWRAAVMQLFTDAFSTSKKKRNFKFKRMAKAFVRLHNPNFIALCEMAYYDPAKVVEHFKRLEREELN